MGTKLFLASVLSSAAVGLGGLPLGSVAMGMQQCSSGYSSCLRTASEIKKTHINNLAVKLKNDQELMPTSAVSNPSMDNYIFGDFMQHQVDVTNQLMLPVLRLIEPNDVVVGHFDRNSITEKVGKLIDQYNRQNIDFFLKEMNLDHKAKMLKQDAKTVLKQWVIYYLNRELYKMRDDYLTHLMGGHDQNSLNLK